MEMEGKVALITGASGGIGAAVARRLHAAGASVGLLSRSGDDLGLDRGLGVVCDVRYRDAVGAATEAVVEHFGRLDIVVANAGVGAYGPFLELDPEQVEAMIDINLKGTLYTAAATLPHVLCFGVRGVEGGFGVGDCVREHLLVRRLVVGLLHHFPHQPPILPNRRRPPSPEHRQQPVHVQPILPLPAPVVAVARPRVFLRSANDPRLDQVLWSCDLAIWQD